VDFSDGGGGGSGGGGCAAATFHPAEVACGSEHTLVRGGCGCVAAFGWNEHGNLGTGDTSGRASPARVADVGCGGGGGGAKRADAIAAGGAVSFVRVSPSEGPADAGAGGR
jgi:hypothetical protein